jgi:hypothetical protein
MGVFGALKFTQRVKSSTVQGSRAPRRLASTLLPCRAADVTVRLVKVLSIEEAQARFDAVCREVMSGEIIRLQLTDGALIQLTPVPTVTPLSDRELAECYADEDWAAFENHCGKASD